LWPIRVEEALKILLADVLEDEKRLITNVPKCRIMNANLKSYGGVVEKFQIWNYWDRKKDKPLII
jgi:hypothetical protein